MFKLFCVGHRLNFFDKFKFEKYNIEEEEFKKYISNLENTYLDDKYVIGYRNQNQIKINTKNPKEFFVNELILLKKFFTYELVIIFIGDENINEKKASLSFFA